jgi:predicted nucleotidyltransferase
MSIRIKLFRELKIFCKEYFKTRDYFVLVYGSYASNDFAEKSDLDLFIATDEHDMNDFKKVRDFVVDLHTRNNLKINEEVPYKNKLIVSYEDAADALNLKAFIRKGARYIIPPVTADEEFLASKEVRFRIILNALTSPNLFICGNRNKYNSFKSEAERAIIKLAYGVIGSEKLTQEEILNILLKGVNGEEGGDYLGYRPRRRKVVKYLKKLISINI